MPDGSVTWPPPWLRITFELLPVIAGLTVSLVLIGSRQMVLDAFRNGQYDRALRLIRAMEWFPFSSRTLPFLKGMVLMFAGRNQEAEYVLRNCVAKRTGRTKSSPLVNLGYVLVERRQYAEAAKVLDEAIQLSAHETTAYSTRAEVYLRQGIQPEAALELIDHGIANKQASEIERRRNIHMFGYLYANRAWALFLLRRPAEAEQALDEAEKWQRNAMDAERFKPTAAGIRYRMGMALQAAHDATRAWEQFRQACEIDPEGKYAALSKAATINLDAR